MSISGADSNNRMKPETNVTLSWSSSTPKSGTLSAYEVRYTTDGGLTYTTVSTSIDVSTFTYSFTPLVREDEILQVQICAMNSYGKKSEYGNFTPIVIYADGKSVGKIDDNIRHIRGYVKVDGSMQKVKNIIVKANGIIYSIDQYLPPLN